MDEMRRVTQLNRDYIAIAIVIILLVVSLVFIAQLIRLHQTEPALSGTLSTETTGEEPTGVSPIEPGDMHPGGGGPDKLGLPLADSHNSGNSPDGIDEKDEEGEMEGEQSPEHWSLEPRLPRNMDLANGSWPAESAELEEDRLVLDNDLPSMPKAKRGRLYAQDEMLLPGYGLMIRFLPRIALVIDDWGYDWAMAKNFLSLDLPFTAAVLPYRAKTQEQLTLLRQRGHEVILHLPMEPKNPGIELDRECITTDLSDEEIHRRVEAALGAIGQVAGVNNHMGSKATSDARVAQVVLEVIKDHGLYFVDSWTAPTSVAGRLAGEMGIPTATNQVFLDHYDDVDRVKKQVERLIRLAKQDGQALGIGHVRPQTYQALVEMIPRFHEEGIVIVPASQVVAIP